MDSEQREFQEFSSLSAKSGGFNLHLSLKTDKLVFRRPFLLRFFDVEKNEEKINQNVPQYQEAS